MIYKTFKRLRGYNDLSKSEGIQKFHPVSRCMYTQQVYVYGEHGSFIFNICITKNSLYYLKYHNYKMALKFLFLISGTAGIRAAEEQLQNIEMKFFKNLGLNVNKINIQIMESENAGKQQSSTSTKMAIDPKYEKMMNKMGWTKGQGIGKGGDGIRELISVESKPDRSGFGRDTEDYGTGWRKDKYVGKQPTAQLFEFCQARKMEQPKFTLTLDEGPRNDKRYRYKASSKYQKAEGAGPSRSKKDAKAEASKMLLKEFYNNLK
ncbi:uncharacterized protein [Prorops nasuta]|uniref:uncharacterized protein n=1 Tax=Prorops nasuta TaxID=863751 RepID=UPI0034CD38D7